jgi:hypothetical protein
LFVQVSSLFLMKTKVAEQPKLTCIQKVTIEQHKACNEDLACAFYACNIPFAMKEISSCKFSYEGNFGS